MDIYIPLNTEQASGKLTKEVQMDNDDSSRIEQYIDRIASFLGE